MTWYSCPGAAITGTGISRSEAQAAREPACPAAEAPPSPAMASAKTVSGAAGNLVSSLQVFSGALLGDGAAFTSAITRVTNPPPVPARSVRAATAAAGRRLRLRLRLRRLRLRLRRGGTMKTYALKKGIAATLVALAAAAFAAAAAARIFSRGRFLAIDLSLSRYGRVDGLAAGAARFPGRAAAAGAAAVARLCPQEPRRIPGPRTVPLLRQRKNSAPSASTCGWRRTARPS